MRGYKKLIPQNVATESARRIAIYDANGNRVGQIPLKTLTPPNPKKKLYSFGALSDIHLQYDTAVEDFRKALIWFNENGVSFVCVCGDLSTEGTAEELTQYKTEVETYSPQTPVYTMAGNHDARSGLAGTIQNYTGNPNHYSITHGEDVFIFVGVNADWTENLFTDEELQWLYETLETNRNKRCFVFEHILTAEGCGDVLNIYPYTKLGNGTDSVVFKSLLKHYTNAIFFHGHSHMKFNMQEYGNKANYDNVLGCHSIHIPSLAVPRDIDGETYKNVYAEAEGYVVDVYENGIHLRGRDFVKGEFLPIASYWLDTPLQTITPRTYKDNTGTITT